MSADEGDLYDELVNDSFTLCRRMRTVSAVAGWVAVLMGAAVMVQAALILWPDSTDGGWFMYAPAPDSAQTTAISIGSVVSEDFYESVTFRSRTESALDILPGVVGWALLVAIAALSLRVVARRLELDLVGDYSDDD